MWPDSQPIDVEVKIIRIVWCVVVVHHCVSVIINILNCFN